MIDTATSEKLATALSFMGVIPSFDGALLFSEDVTDVTGYQIKCRSNEVGRLVYSIVDLPDLPHGRSKFKSLYLKIHGNPVREDETHDINTVNYPTMGSDYVSDISPATIVRLLRVVFEGSNEVGGILPAYIMRLTQEIARWEAHFASIHKKTNMLKTVFEQILQESF